MKKLFISQPMKDKTDAEILAVREQAIQSAKNLLGEDVEVIDSFFQNVPHDATPLWFLAKSLELLATADVVYFAKDWEKYRGCRIENTCAIEYGIKLFSPTKHYHVNNWLTLTGTNRNNKEKGRKENVGMVTDDFRRCNNHRWKT